MNEFIEKLIGRLEEQKSEVNGLSDIVWNNAVKMCIYEIDQLAEEYDNDVCEWEKGSSGYVGYPAYYSRCCTTNSNGLEMQTHIISDWKFCPYCGKKIKVVEPKGE